MSKVSFISVNGSGGAYVNVPVTQVARRVEIIEDESVTPQGLTVKFPQDSFTQVYTYGASTEPIVIGNVVANQNGVGGILGLPGQNVPAAYNGGTTYNAGDQALSNDANGNSMAWVCILNGTVGITPVTGANWTLAPRYRAGDAYCQVRSNTVTATKIRVVEYD